MINAKSISAIDIVFRTLSAVFLFFRVVHDAAV